MVTAAGQKQKEEPVNVAHQNAIFYLRSVAWEQKFQNGSDARTLTSAVHISPKTNC